MKKFNKVKSSQSSLGGCSDLIEGYTPQADGYLKDGDIIEVQWGDGTITEHKAKVTRRNVGCEYPDFDDRANIEIEHCGTILEVSLRYMDVGVRRKRVDLNDSIYLY